MAWSCIQGSIHEIILYLCSHWRNKYLSKCTFMQSMCNGACMYEMSLYSGIAPMNWFCIEVHMHAIFMYLNVHVWDPSIFMFTIMIIILFKCTFMQSLCVIICIYAKNSYSTFDSLNQSVFDSQSWNQCISKYMIISCMCHQDCMYEIKSDKRLHAWN